MTLIGAFSGKWLASYSISRSGKVCCKELSNTLLGIFVGAFRKRLVAHHYISLLPGRHIGFLHDMIIQLLKLFINNYNLMWDLTIMRMRMTNLSCKTLRLGSGGALVGVWPWHACKAAATPTHPGAGRSLTTCSAPPPLFPLRISVWPSKLKDWAEFWKTPLIVKSQLLCAIMKAGI